MKYLIPGIIIFFAVLASITLIFDWGRRGNPFVTEPIGDIIVDSPKVNSEVGEKIAISGKAKGNWFFEASFPIQLQDPEGNILATGTASANGDWMTENFVPFSASLSFSIPTTTGYGIIIFKNDNPSGDPARDKTFEVPVSFSK